MKFMIELSVDEFNKLYGGDEKLTCGNRKNRGPVIFDRRFDRNCVGWTDDSRYNRYFLSDTQRHCNDLLRDRGHLFLNEVYDMLGFPRISAGQVFGWIYKDENSHVDFDISKPCNVEFGVGFKTELNLSFNVDGIIIDKI